MRHRKRTERLSKFTFHIQPPNLITEMEFHSLISSQEHNDPLLIYQCTCKYLFLLLLLFLHNLSQSSYHLLIRALSATFFTIVCHLSRYLWSLCDNFNCGKFSRFFYHAIFSMVHQILNNLLITLNYFVISKNISIFTIWRWESPINILKCK